MDLETEVKLLIKEKPDLSIGAYMGLLMNKFVGKVNGKALSDELRRQLG